MLINKTYEISSCDDIELNIKRTSKLEYRMTYDDEKQMKAIVFVIGGYGANANISFLDFDREYIAKKFDVVVVNVFYHCFCSRKSIDEKYNPKLIPNKEDLIHINHVLKSIDLAHIRADENNFSQIIPIVDEHLEIMKQKGQIQSNQKIEFCCDFVPPNNEYQNYGIMAAIDHINALKDIVKNYPQFENLPKIYGGGSYGGYLSLLIAKIAPWYVDGVIDNSGSPLPLLNYIIGRDLNTSDFIFNNTNTLIAMFVKTYWIRKDEHSPYFFSNENYIIRTLLNSSHLKIQTNANNNIIFISYHSSRDEFNTTQDKQTLFSIYKEFGYDATLYLVYEEDIDGKMIKSLDHGMRITDKALFRKELPLMLEKLQKRKSFMQENSISYPCGDKIFTFKDEGDKFVLCIK
ncbi:DUF2920 family protein [Campylobacter molothri]|uniref:DUF2920 family protein n=1 Tax=Campylobacter molothri TaxID=1032242 RepID=UPI001DE99DA8|nr:DUF2920 family protein [Campylobacter sp. RM12397]